MYGGSIMSIRNKKAFTLIEMLVVVLIIGILAAIALPQYMKAIARARMSEMLSVIKIVYRAQELHKLVEGSWTPDLNNLDIDGLTNCTISESSSKCDLGNVRVSYFSIDYSYGTAHYLQVWNIKYTDSLPVLEAYSSKNMLECLTGGDEKKAKICQMYSSTTRPNSPNYYILDF
jgi:prepilin-type N-terminal cleavage/methylation domain-containing protein